MKKYDVWIYDEESGCNHPMKCEAKNISEARRIGKRYIKQWRLVGATITEIKEVEV